MWFPCSENILVNTLVVFAGCADLLGGGGVGWPYWPIDHGDHSDHHGHGDGDHGDHHVL